MQHIPKHIHYFWFGNNKKSPLVTRCINSWQTYLPDYQLKEWNETNYDVLKNDFTTQAYHDKKWAFLSDYARIDILNQYGGIYLDTDMEVIKPLDKFLGCNLFIGMESNTHVNGSIIGSIKDHWYLKAILNAYHTLAKYEPIPVLMTDILTKEGYLLSNIHQQQLDIDIFPTEYFYPFPFGTTFSKKCLTENTHTIHWWNHSWGSKKARILKKFGLLKPALWLKSKFM